MFSKYTIAALLVAGASAQVFPAANTSFASSFNQFNVQMNSCTNDT